MENHLKKIAIIGRPNVGKSTLFNRLTGKKHALVDDQPGVTRDVREGEANIADLEFIAMDTAGMEESGAETLEGRMFAQSLRAAEEADLAMLVIDAKAGVTPKDEAFASQLRRMKTPVMLVVNKAEAKGTQEGVLDAYRLGLGEPVAISAEHGEGMAELYDALEEAGIRTEKEAAEKEHVAFDPDDEVELDTSTPVQIAVVGRPNAGKSTFINRLLGEERLLTGPEAGITRDSITIPFEWAGRALKMVDTAGMRRKANVQEKLEKMAVTDSLRAIQYAHVVVLMIDATQPLEKQDIQIGSLVANEGRACILAVNKWDLIEGDHDMLLEDIEEHIEQVLPQLIGMPVVPISCAQGKGMDKVLDACLEMYAIWNQRIPTARLNGWLEEMVAKHTPPLVKGRRIKLKYMTQSNTRPPTFALHVNMVGLLPSYKRYLEKGLRETFNLPGVPLRLMLRKSKNPYDEK